MAVGIYHRAYWIKILRYLVMVGDHEVHPKPFCQLYLLSIRDAAIYRDYEADTAFRELFDCRGIKAVPLLKPVRDVIGNRDTEFRKEIYQQGSCGNAVRVIVTKDGNLFMVFYGLHDKVNRPVHVLKQHGVRKAGKPG